LTVVGASQQPNPFFDGTGDVRTLCRSIDWSKTPLGAATTWSPSLKMAVRLCLDCRTATALWIGPTFTLIHNDAYAVILAKRFPDALGRPLREVWPEVYDQVVGDFHRVFDHGENIRHDQATFRLLRDGYATEAHFAYSLTPLKDVDGAIIGVFNLVEETTPLVRAKEERERKYQSLFGRIEEALCVVEPILDAQGKPHDYRFLEINPAFARQAGYANPLGKTARQINPLLDQLWPETVARVAATGEPVHVEGRALDLDRWFDVFAFKVEGDASAKIGMLFRDITSRKHAEEELRQAVARYEEQVRLFESVTSTTPDFVYVFDLDGRVAYANRRLLEVWGMKLADALGKTCRELGYEQWHHDLHMREIAQVIATKRPIKGEVPFKAPLTGIFGIYEYIFAPVTGPNGEVQLIAGTTRDVTERRAMEDELRATKEKLEEADRRKNHFLAVLSHELRNPLTPIKNSLYILDRAVAGGDQSRRAMEVIARQVDQLSHIVDDLLDLTRIARGKIQIQRRRFELGDLIQRSIDDHRALFQTAAVNLDVQVTAWPVYVDADWNRIAQVVSNLLQNSAKFTPAGGHVTISLDSDPESGQAIIRVADTGSGMKPALLAHLFEPFMQADETLDRSKGGLGLGLALVKGLVEQHGGSIEAHSEGIDRGSEFIVRLPLDLSATQDLQTGPSPEPGSHRKVLIIEDNFDAASSLKELLELWGHEVAIAHDGPEGLAMAHEARPDVVLCDIGLPGMDGYDVARAFRHDEDLSRIQLVALSGYALPEDLHRAAEAGFERHMAKPPSPEKLEALLSNN
jgi:PAS domain S-box-containing protein